MGKVAVAGTGRKIARPLKVLIPLIQEELQSANEAALEYYLHAGELLIEAKSQITDFTWGKWLSKNFELSARTARRWMDAVRVRDNFDENNPEDIEDFETAARGHSLSGLTGEREQKARSKSKLKALLDAIAHVDTKALTEERQTRQTEIELRREMALQLIDLGFRAMAMRLHPDKGGTREAMERLNAVREELKSVAATRRYI